MNSGAADETHPAGDATEDDTRQTGAPDALGHTPRHTPPRAAVSGCLVVCRLDAVTPLAPRSDGCVYNPGRSSDLLRLVPLPAPPCGGSGSLHEAIRELTAAGQSGTHTPFPINRRDANPDTAKVTLPPQSAKGNGRFLPSQATERRGDGTRAPEGQSYKQRREGDRRRARKRKCTRMTAAAGGERRGSARLSK